MTTLSEIEERLFELPRKIGIPLKELLSKGYISEQILTTVLDAGDIAVDRSKLIGFTIGYLHVRQSGVPILDVVRMSRSLGRKINLDWSIPRWKAEHDRLSRAETMKRLSDDIVFYDLSDYDTTLPAKFSGYLIRSSRRLGMEGLRQRHCVASYHQQLVNKYCAISCVFVDRVRWTVQLNKTGREDVPIRISQIRSRLNAIPTPAERSRIHEILGIEQPVRGTSDHPARPDRPRREYLYLRNLRRALPMLRQHGVTRAIVTFDGSGDSGSVDGTTFEPDSFPANTVQVPYLRGSQELENGSWITITEEVERPITDAIEDIATDYLEETGVNYYDNEGGFGELVVDVDAGTVYLEINCRIMDSEVEFSATVDIESGDTLDEEGVCQPE